MVDRGKFFLYDAYLPALEAGRYHLTSDVELFTTSTGSPDPDLDVARQVTHINVTAPRYKLPPDMALLTFPPANSEGAYESRLPQIVLKRRTLPWDRDPAPTGARFHGQTVVEETPWLALVVIAEGEGTIEHDIPVADCVSAGVTLAGDADTATATRLSVPHSTVQAVFPTVDDLIMLTHVREVNLDDTEAAMGDDDGFLAVVIANRMPQFDRENCRPKAYTACLVNLEGQLDRLPPPAPPRSFFNVADLHISSAHAAIAAAVRSGAAVPLASSGVRRTLDPTDGVAMTEAIRRGEVVFHRGRLTDRAGITADGLNVLGDIDPASLLDGDFSGLAAGAASARAEVTRVKGTFGGFNLPLDQIFPEQIYRFPVLTSWRFTCAGAGSFEKLMRNLDVGLLGAKTAGAYERPQPECTPEETGEGPGDAPVTKLPLEIAETGHVGLPHLTRTGTQEDAWYRGPFSPHRLMRRVVADEASDRPVLAHVSDHLRMMTPQGRQDVSLAVAFETGRLLAMSQPSFVASLMRWRARSFGADLLRAKQRTVFVTEELGPILALDRIEEAIGRGVVEIAVESGLFFDLARRWEDAIGPAGPLVNPGLPVRALEGRLTEHVAVGLGIDRALLDRVSTAPQAPDTVAGAHSARPSLSVTGALADDRALTANLEDTLDRGLTGLAELAVGREVIEIGDLDRLETFDDLSNFLLDRLEKGRGPR